MLTIADIQRLAQDVGRMQFDRLSEGERSDLSRALDNLCTAAAGASARADGHVDPAKRIKAVRKALGYTYP